MNKLNLIGQKFFRLTVISDADFYIHPSGKKSRQYLCRCDCGNECVVLYQNMRRGMTKSCGCLRSENSSYLHKKHGMTISPEYETWCRIIQRCTNPNNPDYPNYGGRGIKICDRWINSFENFLADMGNRPSSYHSIERSDVNGDYESLNCKWATRKEQSVNKRNNVFIEYRNEVLCVSEWANIFCINSETLRSRLNAGWCIEKALNTPIRKRIR